MGKTNAYHFITHWRVRATREEVFAILGDAEDLAVWWPSVYLRVIELHKGNKEGLGKVVRLYTKGWLPYTLHWSFSIVRVDYPIDFALAATGDFVGRGLWTFEEDGDYVDITYDWKISAEKPLLKYFSFIMKPIFSANHHWAMHMGEESLKLELLRRRAKTPAEMARIPAPPPPTFQRWVAAESSLSEARRSRL
ncbi:MAG: polyketide cyclase [Anaerolineae bacterium]